MEKKASYGEEKVGANRIISLNTKGRDSSVGQRRKKKERGSAVAARGKKKREAQATISCSKKGSCGTRGEARL